jgi:hypothetical protein
MCEVQVFFFAILILTLFDYQGFIDMNLSMVLDHPSKIVALGAECKNDILAHLFEEIQ